MLPAPVIDLVEASGARWVRAELHWSVIQPTPDAPLDFTAYDAMIDAYTERGISVQAILTYIPPAYERDWDRIDEGFRAFATAAVQRYAARGVHHWEVFNVWFSAKDYSSRASAPTFGLADFDGTRRPSFETFRMLVREE